MEKNRVRELRDKTGLSARAFGEKYGIPMRTVQDWERGVRTAPEYVIDMLAHEIAAESIVPMVYVFHKYRGGAGLGEDVMFASKEFALLTAASEWDRLTDNDKASYKNDPAGEYCVAFVPAIWDDVSEEYYPDMTEYTPIWSAL